jgi:hypothetical protein
MRLQELAKQDAERKFNRLSLQSSQANAPVRLISIVHD